MVFLIESFHDSASVTFDGVLISFVSGSGSDGEDFDVEGKRVDS